MSDEEIESVARNLCKSLGLDPDKRALHGYGDTMTPAEYDREVGDAVPMIALYSPRWMIFRGDAARALAARAALNREPDT